MSCLESNKKVHEKSRWNEKRGRRMITKWVTMTAAGVRNERECEEGRTFFSPSTFKLTWGENRRVKDEVFLAWTERREEKEGRELDLNQDILCSWLTVEKTRRKFSERQQWADVLGLDSRTPWQWTGCFPCLFPPPSSFPSKTSQWNSEHKLVLEIVFNTCNSSRRLLRHLHLTFTSCLPVSPTVPWPWPESIERKTDALQARVQLGVHVTSH